MSRALRACVWLAGLGGAWPSTARAERRFPPPQFDTAHTVPSPTAPPADAAWWGYADVALLLGALALGAWLVLRRRSRRGVFALAIGCLVYFGFVREGCVCAIGSIQNVSLALADPAYALPWVVAAFFLLPIVFTLFFGRIFCAGVCPLGAIQDVVAWRPVRLPVWLDHALGLVAYLYLGAAVLFAATGSAFLICEYDPFVGFFRMSGATSVLIFGGALLVAGLFVVRPYCRFLCPYGVVLGWLSPFARTKPRIDPTDCIQCHLCKDACPINAIETPSIEPDRATVSVDAKARRRMAGLVILLPVLVAAGAWGGALVATRLARLHPRVALQHAVERGDATGRMGEAAEVFRASGETPAALQADASSVVRRFAIGAPVLGAFMGLVVGLKLIALARRPGRRDYDIAQSRCVACARCFEHCPHDPRNVELLRRVELTRGATA